MDSLVNLNWNKITPCLVLLILEVALEFTDCATQADVNKHLELGRDFLARGQLSDALTHYHAAVEGDPHNYLTYFKRGTVYYALGKAKFALQDFTKVLELKADFTSARMQRANVYLKLGQYPEAKEDYLQVTHAEPAAARLALAADEHAEALRLAEAYFRGRDFRAALEQAARLLDASPWSARLRGLRAECHIALDDLLSAVADIRSANRLGQDSTEGHLRLATILYRLGHVGDALKEVRECLRLDPEHRECFPLYKKVKRADGLLLECERRDAAGERGACADAAARLLALAERDADGAELAGAARRWRCACLARAERWAEALAACGAALQPRRDARVLCDRGDALLGLEMYDDAALAFKEALELEEGLQRAKDGLARAQALQRQAERRDYYKILGVERSATKQEIVKAYRKAAQKWHPDSYHGDQKKMAEKKFIDIAAAKEVLTDPEKRAQFDAGADPLDPEAARGGGFHSPFHHFQHGSPFQFKFHFN